MKTHIKFAAALVLLSTAMISIAQVVEEPYEVGTWKNFAEAAITYTFDDNCSNQYSVAIPMFNEFGFHATFFPVIDWSPNWTTFQSAASAGHEIGSHTVSHPHLGELSDSLQNVELRDSQDTINDNITGQSCHTIAYPYCDPSTDTITLKYYIAARHCQGNIEKSTPDDFLNISSIICGAEGSIKTPQDFNNKANSAAASNGWNVYLLHGIDSDGGYSPVPSAVLRESLEYLDYKRDKFWVSTFMNVVCYIRERNAVSVEELEISEDTIKVHVSDTLDDAIYNFPVTIRRPLPVAWEYAAAFQDGMATQTVVKEIASEKYIEFDAIPDGGEVIIISAEEPPYVPLVDKPYEVATWRGFTEAAITYSFDDNCPNQYSVAIPMFDEFGYHATFFPVIDWSPNWTTFQNAASTGHEIGSHTVSHPHLGDLSDSLQNIELKDSQDEINANITGQSCLTIAYPYCEPSIDTLTLKYYIAARHCQGNIEKTTPDDFLNISSIMCGPEGSIETLDDFNNNANTTADSNGWSVYLIHGIDSDGGFSPVSTEVLRGSLQYLDENRDKFWVSNFVNVVRYIRERNSISVNVLDVFNDSIQLQLTDTLENAVYNVPVSIRRSLPYGWTYAKVFQDGDSVQTDIFESGSVKYVEFQVVPDKGVITITAADVPQVSGLVKPIVNEKSSIRIMPNPFSSEIRIQTEGMFRYAVYALDGRLMENGTGFQSEMVGASLRPGIYIFSIQYKSELVNTKIVKR